MHFHLISEKDIREERICPYCRKDVKDEIWTSAFHCEAHYKEVRCSCGKTLHFKVWFDGSGHDHLSKGKKKDAGDAKETSGGVKTLDSRIKLLQPT
jgi:hypothetical protein